MTDAWGEFLWERYLRLCKRLSSASFLRDTRTSHETRKLNQKPSARQA